MCMDKFKLFAEKQKRTSYSDTSNKNMQPGYRNRICCRKMCHADDEKWKKKE